ncbi:large conductance mechanosensitive channel protein MscL [Micromonospora endophytica]|uniref:Large-conductance mechanosensitive channel n=1 Tax=Micromonospora endophytica TaxID=515350 RepID=A0A2W2C3R6_9ACTN|nr:large conductance mechanosensitive channel protein MscL [Micromonospora endophytica]PZF82879.1 large conductance mechanosensitive channel protein MscL [Micromonospora endophytica]RIW49113.1 large conductance mechanosensitive channel protein MscL [Micromonospora endophytica]BCJ59132.1 large-conductance mechanosensitive channel [Micromonospora endophytica]
MLKGFKDFIMRGNVVDLAVGVVIGAAFTGLVTAFTNAFLKPLIKFMGGGRDEFAGSWKIGDDNFITWADFVNALITFLLTAAVLYFLVVFPMNKLAERRRRGEEPPPAAPSEEVKLLTEIRDALVAAGRTTPAQQRGALDDVLGHREEPPTQR